MKKLFRLTMALFVMAAPLVAYLPVHAGGSTYSNYSNLRLSASKSSATANNSDSITFTISFFLYKCTSGATRIASSSCASEGGVAGEEAVTCDKAACQITNYAHAKVTVSGSGNTLSKTILYPNSSGKATFTLKSSAAGSKTVKISNEAPSSSYAEASKTVSFAAAQTAPKPTTSTKPAAPKKTVTAPATPKLATITIDNKAVDLTKKVQVAQNKPLVLGGKTVANGKITLYIFSDPKTATVTADKDGNWTYSVTDLPAGDHHIESEVTDPATSKTSKRESVLAFTVTAAEATPTVQSQPMQTPAKSKTSLVVPIVGAVAVLALAGSAFWWKKKRAKSLPENMDEKIEAFKEKESERPAEQEPNAEPEKDALDNTPKEESDDTPKDNDSEKEA